LPDQVQADAPQQRHVLGAVVAPQPAVDFVEATSSTQW
jgi:hypothetical protein